MEKLRRIWKPFFLSLTICVLGLFVVLTFNARFPVVENTSMLSNALAQQGAVLSGIEYSEQTGRYSYTFIVDEQGDTSLTLAIFGARKLALYGFSGLEYRFDEEGAYKGFQIIPLGDGFFRGNTLRIEIEAESFRDNRCILINSASMDNYRTAINIILGVEIGILAIMAMQSVLLYAKKPTEKYLQTFMLYACAVAVLVYISTGLPLDPLLSKLIIAADYNYVFRVFVDCLSMATCFKLLYITPPRLLRHLVSWYGVLSVCLFFFFFSSGLPRLLREILRFSMLFVGEGALIYASSICIPNAKMLLIGYSVTLCMAMISPAADIGLLIESFPMLIFRSLRLAYLPFLLISMCYINNRFANGFCKTEQIAGKLEQLNLSLDVKIKERTAALVDQQRQRQVMMTNIFHDLRTPLFILKGCINLMHPNGHEDEENLAIINDRVDFVTQLTEELFLAAKLEDDEVRLVCGSVELKELLRKLSDASRIACEKEKKRLVFTAPAPCTIWGDALRLRQIFQNLLANAVYYTGQEGEIRLALEIDGSFAKISIQDTGKGIPEKELGNIFKRYYTVSGTDKHSSTGLGLSIAAELVKMHHGSIEVESQLGKGTRFIVRLPLLNACEETCKSV